MGEAKKIGNAKLAREVIRRFAQNPEPKLHHKACEEMKANDPSGVMRYLASEAYREIIDRVK